MMDLNINPILVTGSAGFIGFHLSKRLLENEFQVIGLDNLNDYYDVSLKESRLEILSNYHNFNFFRIDLEDKEGIFKLFEDYKPKIVVNLAAQAGVRYSLINPFAYINANILGFLNILEASRHHQIKHLIYASSSSVYGANTKIPFSVHDNVDHPVSLYAASKKSIELIAHSYAANFNLPVTGLRFFTVYGPYGRPDMAYYIFTNKIRHDEPIDVFNYGKMKRDFTYIDDIVECISRLIPKKPEPNTNWDGDNPNPSDSFAPYRLFNIGNNTPVELEYFIELLERYLGKKAKKNYLPMQKGDVTMTYANVDDLIRYIDYKPQTSIEEGVQKFISWYKSYYK